ncbi:MAG: hypothetical protein JWO56_3496 [Acidobacteria bacterium]|nr:hypothetical protein [Acidobacteriota bacterium]
MRLYGILVLLLGITLNATAAEIPHSKTAEIERLVKAFMAKEGVPGLSIAVVADGRLQWARGYGMANVENRVPARSTTVYRTASMGKTMTAAAAMELAEQGTLDLRADIRDYCPAFPAKPWKITPLNLLSHTSGIRHYGGPRDQEEQFSTTHYPSVVEALRPFKDDPLLFEPGTKYQYSTYGFDVLGCVIEGAAKTPFLTTMRTRVWEPAGMASTRDDDPAAIVPNRAAGYTRSGGALHNAPAIDMSNRLPAGGYLTTAVDLGRFAVALLDNRLISAEAFRKMTTPTVLPDGKTISYALGWGVEPEEWHGDRWLFHGGSSPGASGIIVMMPAHRFAVAFLTNLDELPGRSELAEDITRLILGFPPRK